jgi:hypothetical protein
MRQLERTLRIPEPERVSHSLLAAIQQSIGTVVFQWVLSPAPHQQSPERSLARIRHHGRTFVLTDDRHDRAALTDQRTKLSEPNFLAVLRIGVQAESPAQAQRVVYSVRSALASIRTASNGLFGRTVPQQVLSRRINEARPPWFFPIQLSVTEAVALSAWPISEPYIAGLPQARTRHLPPAAAIPHRGFVLATSNFPGDERPLALAPVDACKHIHVVGPTGTGKTSLLANLAAQHMARGFGLVVIESKGDLFHAVLERIPKKRLDDVIVLDVGDHDYPVGFNILEEGSPRVTVDALCELFEHLYPATSSVWAREVLFYGLSTLTSRPGYTFVDLVPLLMPAGPAQERWRNALIASIENDTLRTFWQRFESQSLTMQQRMIQPVMDRVWQLDSRPEIRNIIGQSSGGLRMSDVVENHKILLVNLAGLGNATANLVGTLIVGALWRAVQVRKSEHQVHLLLDEFQDFLSIGEPSELFTKARSYRLGIVAAHQHLGQLPNDLRDAVLANGHSKVVFRTGADDARVFAREFGRLVNEADFMNLGQYEVLCRFATATGISAPVTALTRPPSRRTGLALEARVLSRERYSRAAGAVEAEIATRRSNQDASPARRPKVGPTPWE